MKKSMKYLVPASLIGGGMVLGSIFSPISLSGAQTGDSDESTTDSTADSVEETSDHSGKGRRGGRGVAKEVLEDLGLSVEDLKAGNEAGLTLVEIAAEAGITEAQLVEAIETATSERLAAAVAEGKIDAEKAAEIEAGMAEKISERINTVHEGREGGGREGGGRRGQIREQLSETLTELGLDSDEVKAGREAGQTLAEIAAESGVSEQDLVDALISGAEERLAEASENGNIDDERLAEIEANLEEKISEMVNKAPGEGGRHGGRGHGGTGEAVESSSEI